MKKKKKKRKIPITRDIYLFSAIEPIPVRDIIRQIMNIRKRTKKPINLYINSPGGACSDGFALIDVIERCQPIRTIILGSACSMAVPILLAGKRGERYIAEKAFIMMHPVSTGVEDYVSFVESRIKHSKKIQKMIDNYTLSKCDIPKKMYNRSKNSEVWLTADEAVQYKIADKIYKKRLK